MSLLIIFIYMGGALTVYRHERTMKRGGWGSLMEAVGWPWEVGVWIARKTIIERRW